MKFILTLCGVVLGGLLSMSVVRAEVAPGAPTILVPMSQTHTSSVKPVIAGVTQTGTQVDVYIDQQFNGRATVKAASGQTAGWSYTPFLNLSQGWHTVTVKAQNSAGVRSAVGSPAYIYIDLLVPAPTLLTPVVNSDTTNAQPWIVGLSKGGMTLEVWIDGALNGQVAVGGTRSQTESFKYHPFLPLSTGTHTVSVVTLDSFGGKAKSASMDLRVRAERLTAVSSAATASTSDATSSSTSSDKQTKKDKVEGTVTPAAPTTQPANETVDSQSTDTNAADTPPETSKRENVLTTIGWVLLALVAIGMITRGRAKQPAVDQLVKIDTTDSTPHVEVIRQAPSPTTAPTNTSSATPANTPPATPPTPPVV